MGGFIMNLNNIRLNFGAIFILILLSMGFLAISTSIRTATIYNHLIKATKALAIKANNRLAAQLP